MNLAEAKAAGLKRKGKKRVGRGRGSGKGKTAGRGSKGQKSRSGGLTRIQFEGGQMPLLRRLPKRGFTKPSKRQFEIVNVGQLNCFPSESVVNLTSLREMGLVKKKDAEVKILGKGKLKVPLEVEAHAFSQEAIKKIQTAGGKIKRIK
jgi:large subunit ribosomal protein L15